MLNAAGTRFFKIIPLSFVAKTTQAMRKFPHSLALILRASVKYKTRYGSGFGIYFKREGAAVTEKMLRSARYPA